MRAPTGRTKPQSVAAVETDEQTEAVVKPKRISPGRRGPQSPLKPTTDQEAEVVIVHAEVPKKLPSAGRQVIREFLSFLSINRLKSIMIVSIKGTTSSCTCRTRVGRSWSRRRWWREDCETAKKFESRPRHHRWRRRRGICREPAMVHH